MTLRGERMSIAESTHKHLSNNIWNKNLHRFVDGKPFFLLFLLYYMFVSDLELHDFGCLISLIMYLKICECECSVSVVSNSIFFERPVRPVRLKNANRSAFLKSQWVQSASKTPIEAPFWKASESSQPLNYFKWNTFNAQYLYFLQSIWSNMCKHFSKNRHIFATNHLSQLKKTYKQIISSLMTRNNIFYRN